MNCLNTMAPGDEDILKYVLDEAPLSQEARAHINQCSTCQQRLASYKGMNAFLTSKLYRSRCPESMELTLYCTGTLSEEERTRIAAHALDCPLCAQEIADTRRFLRDTESLPSVHNTTRRIVATLITPQVSFVTRSAATAMVWPRNYRAEAYSLLLSLSPDQNGKHTLMGTLSHVNEEIEPDVFEGQEVKLYLLPESDLPIISTFMDDMGSFALHAIPIGTYRLLISLPDCEVVVNEVIIAAE